MTPAANDGSRRVIVYGAGAIGGVVGAALFRSGHEVALIARGAHFEAIRDHGLRWVSPDDDVTLPIAVVDDPARLQLRSNDVVMMTMKSQDTADVLWTLAACSPPQIAVVCAQNGVDNEQTVARRFDHVYAANVMCPAGHLEPGIVESYSRPLLGIIDVGAYPSGTDDVSDWVATALSASGFDARSLPDMMRWKYTKLLMNLGNAVDAACRPSDDAELLAARARSEGEACLAAAAIDWAPADEFAARRGDTINAQPIAGRARPGASTWQSLARGTGRVETDHLNGEIVRLGRLAGVPTPVNTLLRDVAAAMARDGEPPESRDAGDLLARVDRS